MYVKHSEVTPALINSLRNMIDDVELEQSKAFGDHVSTTLRQLCDAGSGASYSAILEALTAKEVTPPQRKHVVVCMMLPQTLGLTETYPALFLGGWRFFFVDTPSGSLGLVPASEWIYVGLGTRLGFKKSTAAALKFCNGELLRQVVLRVPGGRHVRAPSPADDTVAVQDFYLVSTKATMTDRWNALRKLCDVMGGESLASLLAKRFVKQFSKGFILQQLEVRSLLSMCCLMLLRWHFWRCRLQ